MDEARAAKDWARADALRAAELVSRKADEIGLPGIDVDRQALREEPLDRVHRRVAERRRHALDRHPPVTREERKCRIERRRDRAQVGPEDGLHAGREVHLRLRQLRRSLVQDRGERVGGRGGTRALFGVLWSNRRYRFGVVAQFFNVAAQVCAWTFLIQSAR